MLQRQVMWTILYTLPLLNLPGPAAQISWRQADLDRWLHDTGPSKTRQEATATGVLPPQVALNESNLSDTSTVLDLNQSVTDLNSIGDLDSSKLDTNTLLLEIRRDIKNMDGKFDKLEQSMSTLQAENFALKEKNKELFSKVGALTQSIEDVRKVAKESEIRSERLEAQSRRDNLKFHGIEDQRNESWEKS